MRKELLVFLVLVLALTGCLTQPVIGSNQIPVKLIINYSGYSQTFDVNVSENTTAFDLLKDHARISYKDSGFGVFINAIDNVSNSNTDYWMFYVDGNLSGVGVSGYFINKSAVIEMRYEKPSW